MLTLSVFYLMKYTFLYTYRRHLSWIGLGVLALLLHAVLANFPNFTENIYSNGLFKGIRYTMDYTVSFSPIPLFYVFLGLLVYWGIRVWLKNRKKKIKLPWSKRLLNIGMSTLSFFGGAVFFFYLLWGFNYDRIPFEEKTGLVIPEITEERLVEEITRVQRLLVETRLLIPRADTSALDRKHFPEKSEKILRNYLVSSLQEMGYDTPGRVRGRRIFPKGLLVAFGASGIYIPFVSEGHVDGSLLPTQLPPVLAHEMGHGYGFTDEGVCNLLGYLSCIRAKEPAIRYAGLLNYWRHLARSMYTLDKEKYKSFRDKLPLGVIADLKSIRINGEKYQAFFPNASRFIYDRYLKGQGISEGILSYDRIVELVMAWNDKES